MPLYRIALASNCAMTALWLPDGEAALMGFDDGSLRIVFLTTGAVQGYSTNLVKAESGAYSRTLQVSNYTMSNHDLATAQGLSVAHRQHGTRTTQLKHASKI